MAAQLISRHGPDFVLFFLTDLFNVFLRYFFLRQKRRRLLNKIHSMNLSKGPPQAPLFSVWIVAQKNDSTNLRKNRRYTFKQQHLLFFGNVLFLFIYLLLSLLLYLLLYVFLIFSIYFSLVCFYFFNFLISAEIP